MEEKVQHNGDGKSVRRREAFKVLTSVAASVVAATVSVLATLVASVVSIRELARDPAILGATLGAAAVLVAFTLLLSRRERGPSRAVRLKEKLADAYLGALNESPLNPTKRIETQRG